MFQEMGVVEVGSGRGETRTSKILVGLAVW